MRKHVVNKALIRENIAESTAVIASLSSNIDGIAGIATEIITALRAGKKVLTAGNGGSAAEALHFAEELTGRFKANREALAAIALPADCTALTCIGNDFGFEAVFSRQIEALGRPGDVLLLFGTSGNSRNLVNALDAADRRKMIGICLLGRNGGVMAGRAKHEIIIRHNETARIQEAHQVILHLVLDLIEQAYVAK